MASRRPLVAGNWKMNGLLADGVGRARDLVAALGAAPIACDVLVCPPATLIAPIAEALRGSPVAWGGQDCHAEDKGAFTGDIGAPMLADLGCRAVIVGHSERRRDHGETDATVRAKALAARRAGLVAIVCVGESEADRDAGRTEAVVGAQLPELALGAPEAAHPEDGLLEAFGPRRRQRVAVHEVRARHRHRLRAAGQRFLRRRDPKLAGEPALEEAHRGPPFAEHSRGPARLG